jgi:hypothetical protein
MNSTSDILSGSQILIRKIVLVIFLMSLFSLFLYVVGSLKEFTDENLLLLLSITSFSSAAVLVSIGIQALIVLFAFLSGKKVFWTYFFMDILLGTLAGGILFVVSFVRVLQAGLAF